MRKSSMSKLVLILTVFALVINLAACGIGAKSDAGNAFKSNKTIDISIFSVYYTPEPPAADNPVTKEFEKKTNTKLNIMWTSKNVYTDKLSVILASGDIPDLTRIDTPDNPLAVQLARNGGLRDFGPYIKDYASLSAYPKEAMDNTKIDGKQYLLPSVRPIAGSYFIWIRTDWLKKLNLKMPETIDEYYNALKAFATQDPDGNGKADTYGFTGEIGQEFCDGYIFTDIFNLSNGQWKMVDGNITNVDLLPETRESLLWMKKLYDEKLIPKDYSVMKGSQYQDLAKAATVGSGRGDGQDAFMYESEAKKIDPNTTYEYIPYMTGPKGTFARGSAGFSGAYVVPKSVNDEKFTRIMELMNYGASDEGFTLAVNGIKGVHYNLDKDGFKVATEQATKDNVSQASFGAIFSGFDPYMWAFQPGMTKDIFERNKKIIDKASPHLVFSPITGLTSDTKNKLGKDFEKKSTDLRTKIILGIEPIESWDKYVESLKTDADFNKMTEEYRSAYAKKTGK